MRHAGDRGTNGNRTGALVAGASGATTAAPALEREPFRPDRPPPAPSRILPMKQPHRGVRRALTFLPLTRLPRGTHSLSQSSLSTRALRGNLVGLFLPKKPLTSQKSLYIIPLLRQRSESNYRFFILARLVRGEQPVSEPFDCTVTQFHHEHEKEPRCPKSTRKVRAPRTRTT